MEKVKILSVGIGGYAQGYLDALLKEENPNFEIVGMVDVAPQNSAVYPQLVERGVKLYASMEAFYEEQTADLAIIVTPIHFHTTQILYALYHGSNVMCEKPLSGVSADEEILVKAMKETGKFVMIGYQWSHSDAILALKEDISAGVFGKAELLKSKVLWPRAKEYFKRGSGWGGKIHASNGAIINDSVVSNATAHYLHNMLYVTGGAHGVSNEVAELQCNLLRVNDIENFDTATVKFTMKDGTKGVYVVSHAVKDSDGPIFEYRFEKGIVTYAGENIVAKFADGTEKNYGDPFLNSNRKVYDAIANAKNDSYAPVCGVQAAAPQVRCVEMIQTHPIYNVRKEWIEENVVDGSHFLYVKDLNALLDKCYEEELLLEELPQMKEMVEA